MQVPRPTSWEPKCQECPAGGQCSPGFPVGKRQEGVASTLLVRATESGCPCVQSQALVAWDGVCWAPWLCVSDRKPLGRGPRPTGCDASATLGPSVNSDRATQSHILAQATALRLLVCFGSELRGLRSVLGVTSGIWLQCFPSVPSSRAPALGHGSPWAWATRAGGDPSCSSLCQAASLLVLCVPGRHKLPDTRPRTQSSPQAVPETQHSPTCRLADPGEASLVLHCVMATWLPLAKEAPH